jgi:S-adenosylmethionine:tRNA ribosyltransferase-isomerase
VLISNFHCRGRSIHAGFRTAGLDKAVYAHAIQHNYRFYSYGDCCLLFPQAS